MIISPSILSADFNRLGEEVEKVIQSGADWIHVDVMDGHFVPNITMGPVIIKNLKKIDANVFLDVHLMIENPDKYIEEFVNAGADMIVVHAETCVHLDRTLNFIKSFGIKCGVAFNPATPLTCLEYIKDIVDMILIMSVNPGFSGQPFIEYAVEKVRYSRKILGPYKHIQVDGGVNKSTIKQLKEAGADVFVSGSYIFGSNDYAERISSLKN